MATQNGNLYTREQLNQLRADVGLPPMPEDDDPNIISRAMEAATYAARDIGEEVQGFVENPDRIPTLLLGYCLGAGTVLLTLLATRLF